MLQDMITYGQHMVLVAIITPAGWSVAKHTAAIKLKWLEFRLSLLLSLCYATTDCHPLCERPFCAQCIARAFLAEQQS